MYNVEDTTAAWSLHWFQIVSNLAHCQQDQQDRTRTSWNSQHSSKWLKFSKPQRCPFPSKRCTSYLVSPLEFAGASQAWHHVGRLRLWAWDKTGLITVRVHPLSSMIIYWDLLPSTSRVAVPALSHRSHLVNWGRSLMSGSPASASPAIHNDDNACHEICVKTHEAKG